MTPIWTGTLTKMRVTATEPVTYHLTDGWHLQEDRTADLELNDYLGQRLQIRYLQRISCVACGRSTRKTFNQGFCFPCARSRAEADICMVKPELCHHGRADDPCRDETFAQFKCFAPHVLYCSYTSGPKVGITRQPNVPSRWIDQGAVSAVPLAVLPDRRAVGLLEKRLVDQGVKDKTHWTRMLKGNPDDSELADFADSVVSRLEDWATVGIVSTPERVVQRFVYPVRQWPTKVHSFNLDKDPVAGGVLQGIKGQYLIFDEGVINVRKFTGYQIEVCHSR